ncbi:hypothetical protein [Lysobacter gummosus]|uniref:hypothetical protein n=1 Tax=Lysobacter gummosus TaxID=262324 RepID=UPI003624FC23
MRVRRRGIGPDRDRSASRAHRALAHDARNLDGTRPAFTRTARTARSGSRPRRSRRR